MNELLLNKVKKTFFDDLDQRSSVHIYGSAATGNWIEGRSDLDLIILLPKEMQVALSHKVREWGWESPLNPILDGYAFITSGDNLSILRLDELARVAFPNEAQIDLVDQWMIKNRSRLLFGEGSVDKLIRDISITELSNWAKKSLSSMSRSNPQGIVPENEIILSKLIWSVSWTARMLMLSKGLICESKRDALEWLAIEHNEISASVRLLLKDFYNGDDTAISINKQQDVELRKYCLGLLGSVDNQK